MCSMRDGFIFCTGALAEGTSWPTSHKHDSEPRAKHDTGGSPPGAYAFYAFYAWWFYFP
jgi:hypothetical protein